jgi:RHS repeat-associated protein
VSQSNPRSSNADELKLVVKYDTFGRVDTEYDANGSATTFAYDSETGERVLATNAEGKTVRWDYDDRGNIVHTWGDVPYPVESGYDELGRLVSLKTYRGGSFSGVTWPGGSGDTSMWDYDEATGFIVSRIDAAGESIDYTYFPGGRLHTRTWARGLVTAYEYDPRTGALTDIDYADNTTDVAYTYDRLGRIATVTDAVGHRTMTYDPETLQLESEVIDGQDNFDSTYDVTLTRKYQDGTEPSGLPGRNAGYFLDDGTSHDVTYGYQADSRFESVAWSVNGTEDVAVYTYVPGSPLLAGMTTASGQATTYDYEPQRELKTQVSNRFGGNLISQYDYAYDRLSRRTSVKNTGSAFAQPAFSKWGYDDRHQLTSSHRYLGTNLDDLSQPVMDEARTYNYDPIGNRTTTTSGASGTETYASNELNQYETVTGGVGLTFDYDEDGNTTRRSESGVETRYVFNGENRLVRVEPVAPSDGDVRVSMRYDFLGRRVEKAVASYSGGTWVPGTAHTFIYDGFQVVAEVSPDDTRQYVWGLDLSLRPGGAAGVGGLVSEVGPSGSTYPLLDANGNVVQSVSTTGTLVESHSFDAFGRAGAGEPQGFGFSTAHRDTETDLLSFTYRDYDPKRGRWINRDPIEEAGGVALYGFVVNAPTDLFDVLGRAPGAPHPHDPFDSGRITVTSESGETDERTSYSWRRRWRGQYVHPPRPPSAEYQNFYNPYYDGTQQPFFNQIMVEDPDGQRHWGRPSRLGEDVIRRGELRAPISLEEAADRWGRLQKHGNDYFWPNKT